MMRGARSVRAAMARVRAMRRVRAASRDSCSVGAPPGRSPQALLRQVVLAFHRRRLGAAQDLRAPGEPAERPRRTRSSGGITEACQVSRTGGPGRASGAVQPVGDALGDSAGHHAAEGAGEHRDGGAGQAAHGGARVGAGAVQDVGDHGEGDDEQALDEGDPAEGRVARQPPRRPPAGARPPGVHHGEGEQGERAGGQAAYQVVVEPACRGAARCGPGGRPPTPRRRRRTTSAAFRSQPRSSRTAGPPGPAVVAGRGRADGRGDGEQAGRGVRGAQPGDQAAPVPEAGPAEGDACRVLDVGCAAGRLPSSGRSSSRSMGRWDSYALQVRWERYHSRPVRAVGTRAARARRRPGRLHQPPSETAGERKPSQECARAHARGPRTARPSGRGRPRRRPRRAAPSGSGRRAGRGGRRGVPCACGRGWLGRIQWARLTTMNGSSSSHRAREPLPEVRLHQT